MVESSEDTISQFSAQNPRASARPTPTKMVEESRNLNQSPPKRARQSAVNLQPKKSVMVP